MQKKEIRRLRLKEWFKDKTLPPKEKSYLSQLMSGRASFGEKAARRIEQTYGMPEGYLGSSHHHHHH
uniref:Phage repressor protein CI n=1 Tax=Escherichia coli O157:H7 TaxID=83334 RepID=UPI0023BB1BD8|nr:Chain A, Phage repressor protein CI [Escherichia coli O157:H7]8C3L_C Chain C, Phage repressor protein CI [Escherichia coli O157:H7]